MKLPWAFAFRLISGSCWKLLLHWNQNGWIWISCCHFQLNLGITGSSSGRTGADCCVWIGFLLFSVWTSVYRLLNVRSFRPVPFVFRWINRQSHFPFADRVLILLFRHHWLVRNRRGSTRCNCKQVQEYIGYHGIQFPEVYSTSLHWCPWSFVP